MFMRLYLVIPVYQGIKKEEKNHKKLTKMLIIKKNPYEIFFSPFHHHVQVKACVN